MYRRKWRLNSYTVVVALAVALCAAACLPCADGADGPAQAADLDQAATAVAAQFEEALKGKWEKKDHVIAFGVIVNSRKEICNLTNSLGRKVEARLLARGYRVVERSHKGWLDDELSEQAKILYDQASASALGKRLGARGMVFGSVADKPGQDRIALDLWLTDLERGEKLATAEVLLFNTPGNQAECQGIPTKADGASALTPSPDAKGAPDAKKISAPAGPPVEKGWQAQLDENKWLIVKAAIIALSLLVLVLRYVVFGHGRERSGSGTSSQDSSITVNVNNVSGAESRAEPSGPEGASADLQRRTEQKPSPEGSDIDMDQIEDAMGGGGGTND